MSESFGKAILRKIDGITILLYVALVVIGFLAVFSVEHRTTDTVILVMSKNYMKQATWFGYSLLLGFVIMLTDSKLFSSIAFLFYTIGLGILVLTIFAGVGVKGSRSWLGIGAFRFQPGEVCKIFTALAISKYISLPETNFKKLRSRLIAAAMAIVPAVIIIMQNETGLALVYFSFFLAMYREGLPNIVLIIAFSLIGLVLATLLIERSALFILLTVAGILVGLLMRFTLRRSNEARILLVGTWLICILFSQVAVPFAFKHVFQKHHIDRIYSVLGMDVPQEYVKEAKPGEKEKVNPSEYNVHQSKIAIGSGGLLGKGFLNGTSTKNQFVPEQNTDFIFCAIGEQFGFVGSFILIALYVSLMMRISIIAERQRSPFSRIYGYCVAGILFFHFAVNLSMTIGLMPVIGITLPLLSYGGSSLLTFSVMIFILLRLDLDRTAMIR